MPRGPKGEKRPADVIGNAVKVMRIATGEEVDGDVAKKPRGQSGGAARASKLAPEVRRKIATKAAVKRWSRAKKAAPEKIEHS